MLIKFWNNSFFFIGFILILQIFHTGFTGGGNVYVYADNQTSDKSYGTNEYIRGDTKKDEKIGQKYAENGNYYRQRKAVRVSLIAIPETIENGQSSVLKWTSENSKKCDSSWDSDIELAGELIVAPATTTAYFVTCEGKHDTGSDDVVVIVLEGSDEEKEPLSLTLSALPDSIIRGETSTLVWSSGNTTSCLANWSVSTSTSGSEVVKPEFTTTFDITCENEDQQIIASTTVVVSDPPPPPDINDNDGNGGGVDSLPTSGVSGGKSGDRVRIVNTIPATPQVLGVSLSCDYLKDHLKIGWPNDTIEMIKLQVFLKTVEGFGDLEITGVFDDGTFKAVSIFQEKYFDDILRPWGHDGSTGFVYILTKKKINEIVCNKEFPLNESEKREIVEYKNYLNALGNDNTNSIQTIGQSMQTGKIKTTSRPVLSQSGVEFSSGLALVGGRINAEDEESGVTSTIKKEGAPSLASAIIAGPQNARDSVNSLFLFVAVLFFAYFLAGATSRKVQKESTSVSEDQKRRKMFYFVLILTLAVLVSLFMKLYSIVLPLFVLIIIMSAYLFYLFLGKSLYKRATANPQEEPFQNLDEDSFLKIIEDKPSSLQTEQKIGFGMTDKEWETLDSPEWTEIESLIEGVDREEMSEDLDNRPD